jgi:hypothetical protein
MGMQVENCEPVHPARSIWDGFFPLDVWISLMDGLGVLKAVFGILVE